MSLKDRQKPTLSELCIATSSHPFTGGIRKLSFADGTETELVAKGNLRYPQLSPDGKFVAYFFDDEQTSRPGIAIIEFVSGALVDTFDLPVTSQSNLYESLFYRGFHWSPDGRAIIYLNTLEGVSNLWTPTDRRRRGKANHRLQLRFDLQLCLLPGWQSACRRPRKPHTRCRADK